MPKSNLSTLNLTSKITRGFKEDNVLNHHFEWS